MAKKMDISVFEQHDPSKRLDHTPTPVAKAPQAPLPAQTGNQENRKSGSSPAAEPLQTLGFKVPRSLMREFKLKSAGEGAVMSAVLEALISGYVDGSISLDAEAVRQRRSPQR